MKLWQEAAAYHTTTIEQLSTPISSENFASTFNEISDCLDLVSSKMFGDSNSFNLSSVFMDYKGMNVINFIGSNAFACMKYLNPFITAQDATDLLVAKQRDYGKKNIEKFGVVGIVIRLNDKIERVHTLLGRSLWSQAFVQDEPIYQTFIDIVGYCVIAKMFTTSIFVDEPEPKYVKEFYLPLDAEEWLAV